MAVDMFLEIKEIPGESSKAGHVEQIDIVSFSFGAVQSGSFARGGAGGGAGKAEFQDISIVKEVDKSSPKLFQACACGTHFPKATLYVRKAGDKLILPVDAVIADKFEENANSQVVDVEKIPAGWRMLDVGPKTLELYKKALEGAKLIVWNGPVGVFEMPKFAEGTFALAKLLAESGATTVIGGGDSASAVKKAGVAKQMTHVSTGGGASLEFLEGKELPGVAALMDK